MENETLKNGINSVGNVNTCTDSKSEKHAFLVSVTFLVALITLASCGTTMDYSIYNADELEDNISSLYSRYERRERNGNFDATGDEFEPYELVEIALHKYEQYDQSYSIVSGLTTAPATRQLTHVFNIKNGDEYFNEALSTSTLVKQAHRFYQEGDTVKEYAASNSAVKEKYATYKDSYEEYDLDDFEEYYGKAFSRASIYIVSSKTVLEQNKVINSDGSVTVSLDLDPILGVLRYVRQMCVNGNLNNEPIFEDTNVSYTFSSDMELISLDVIEHYTVNVLGIDFSSNGWVREEYHGGESFSIPALDESLESYYTEVDFDEN